jgi:hypothetical protein
MIRVLARGHHLQSIEDGAPRPSLDSALAAVCREKYRRVDRFIQLAVLGAARAAAVRRPEPACGLYLGSGFGPMGNNIEYQDQLMRQRVVPKPFNFINTLGSAAGYFVSKELGLTGSSQFVARTDGSLRAALDLALADLDLGRAPQALVVCVEESTQPQADQRHRQGLPEGFGPLGEGSHALLIGAGSRLPRYAHADALMPALQTAAASGAPLFTGHRVDAALTATWNGARHRPALPWHDSGDAAAITAFEGPRLWWLDTALEGGHTLAELVFE